jgi:hypothetical protein
MMHQRVAQKMGTVLSRNPENAPQLLDRLDLVTVQQAAQVCQGGLVHVQGGVLDKRIGTPDYSRAGRYRNRSVSYGVGNFQISP